MATFTAKYPARKFLGNNIPARSETYSQDEQGRWMDSRGNVMLEEDLVEDLKRATNWAEIRRAHFPMVGFGS